MCVKMCRDSSTLYFLGLLLVLVVQVHANRGPCYMFPGDTFLEFRPSYLNISHNAHYNLQFETTASTGVLLYAEGPDDYEGLFLSDGKLIYLLANPSPSGVEGTSGGLYISNMMVNDGSWYMVEVLRNREVRQGLMRSELQTGMIIYDSAKNVLETHIDTLDHHDVVINPTIFLGGISSSLIHTQASSESQFKGRMREMMEKRNALDFYSYSLNSGERVKLCS